VSAVSVPSALVPVERARRPCSSRRSLVLLTSVGLAASALIPLIATDHERIAMLAAVACLAASLALVDPLLFPALALPATLLLQRLGGSAAGKSVDLSDVVLLIATGMAMPMIPWGSARVLRRILLLDLTYQVLIVTSLVAAHGSTEVLDWLHRWLLVSGGVIVGWVLARGGRARQAVSLFLAGTAALAVIALVHAVGSGFHPAQFGSYQKNYIGEVMVPAIVVAHLDPPWLGLDRRLARTVIGLDILGLLASQSKQAIVELVFVLFLLIVTMPSVRRRSRLILIGAAPAAVFAYIVSIRELRKFEHGGFNSLKERSIALTQALAASAGHRWFGLGPHWYFLARYAGNIQPPDVFVEELAATGILGLFGLMLVVFGSAAVLARLPRSVGMLGLVLVLGRLVDGIFDIYWVSATGTLPWLFVGLSAGIGDSGWCKQFSLRQSHTVSTDDVAVGAGTAGASGYQ
jgi:hypothetical protein